MYTQTAKISAIVTTTLDIDFYIKQASSFMDKYVGYKIGFVNSVDNIMPALSFNGTGTNTLQLDMFIREHNSIKINEKDIVPLMSPFNSPYTNELILTNGVFNAGYGNVTITDVKVGRYNVNFGDVSHNLPQDLENACILLTVSAIKSAQGQNVATGAVSGESIGAYSISYDNSVYASSSQDEKVSALRILNNYCILTIA